MIYSFHFFLFKEILKRYKVVGTGSLHPCLRDFCNELSDIDLVINSLDSLGKIQQWVEKIGYCGEFFMMVGNKVYFRNKHIADIILMSPKDFPKKHIICEKGFPWVTHRTLLANYRHQYEPDAPGFDPSKRQAEKIEHLQKLTQKTREVTLDLSSNSPLFRNKRKRGLDFGDLSPQSGSKRKLDFGDSSLQSDDTQIVKTLFFK